MFLEAVLKKDIPLAPFKGGIALQNPQAAINTELFLKNQRRFL